MKLPPQFELLIDSGISFDALHRNGFRPVTSTLIGLAASRIRTVFERLAFFESVSLQAYETA
jgi:hypothetical protein